MSYLVIIKYCDWLSLTGAEKSNTYHMIAQFFFIIVSFLSFFIYFLFFLFSIIIYYILISYAPLYWSKSPNNIN